MPSDLERLTRWELSGGTWRVLGRSDDGVEIALETCTGGELVDVLVSSEESVLAYTDRPQRG